jgi:hypothetical protein
MQQVVLLTVADKFSIIFSKCWCCSMQNSAIYILKSHLFGFIDDNVCSQFYVVTKVCNIFFRKSPKLLYMESHNNPKEVPHFTESDFSSSLFITLQLYRSTAQTHYK